jgi:hypothetical protein
MGYVAQQYDGRENPTRRDNLWKPVRGDHGAHGDFDTRASSTSIGSLAETHATLLAVAAGALAAGAAWTLNRKASKTTQEQIIREGVA